ncbi:hypothetical protein K7I13_09050 [Brucepastera parasyntrophica]|uniref:hypothetical protein n=1 Tax=Brucepastera parasyntrophica TaxID=2880008 RepID=UPI00210B518A|nr:hypothetical protein [Brucepastera parasyntrophica]ULQ58703.1 hypothetical protein K7I13_09050 [Brucepastera parasyntrophica]
MKKLVFLSLIVLLVFTGCLSFLGIETSPPVDRRLPSEAVVETYLHNALGKSMASLGPNDWFIFNYSNTNFPAGTFYGFGSPHTYFGTSLTHGKGQMYWCPGVDRYSKLTIYNTKGTAVSDEFEALNPWPYIQVIVKK